MSEYFGDHRENTKLSTIVAPRLSNTFSVSSNCAITTLSCWKQCRGTYTIFSAWNLVGWRKWLSKDLLQCVNHVNHLDRSLQQSLYLLQAEHHGHDPSGLHWWTCQAHRCLINQTQSTKPEAWTWFYLPAMAVKTVAASTTVLPSTPTESSYSVTQ